MIREHIPAPDEVEVPLREPSTRKLERDRIAAIMRGPSIPIEPRGVRLRRFERASARDAVRGPVYRPRGFYGTPCLAHALQGLRRFLGYRGTRTIPLAALRLPVKP